MKDLPVRKGRRHILALVAQGEHQTQDFKFLISDARKIARSISAFANHSGGCLLIGVKDNGIVAGVRNEEDIYVVEQAAQRYCRPAQHVEFEAYSVDTGIVVIKAMVAPCSRRPVQVVEADGSLKAYFRVADENITAHPLMVRSWLMRQQEGTLLKFSELEQTVTDLVAHEALSPDDVPYRLGISKHLAGDLIVRLLAAGVITMDFLGGDFKLVLPPI